MALSDARARGVKHARTACGPEATASTLCCEQPATVWRGARGLTTVVTGCCAVLICRTGASVAAATDILDSPDRHWSGATLSLGMGIALGCALVQPASANLFGDPNRPVFWQAAPGAYDPYNPAYGGRATPPRPIKRMRAPKKPDVEKPVSDMEKQADRDLKAKLQPGPLHVMISIDDQSLALYSNGALIARSPVSTGVPGHPTPTGVFSIIQKRRFHNSNIYSGAPMPYMQRITWSGIALHQGVVPGRPASHGCIRLPEAFARQFWGISKIGARVIITRQHAAPVTFAHARLFVAKAASDAPMASIPSPAVTGVPRPKGDSLRVAKAGSVATDASAQAPLPAASPADASPEPAPDKSAEKPLRAGPVSVFVSRKEGKLFVRKGFQPVFDAPVSIERPEAPLGTHLFTAMALNADGVNMRWTAITIPTAPERKAEPAARAGVKTAQLGIKQAEPAAAPSPAEALDRITIPPETLERITSLMGPGASFIVSDNGLGYETGLETDFVVVTR